MRVAFYTLGCKVNQYETEVLSARFAAEGALRIFPLHYITVKK